jgi:hypothetical protein
MTKLSGSDAKSTLYCSFCGKSQHEVRKLIAGPTVFICDECVELCNDIIREETKAGIAGKKDGGVPSPRDIFETLNDYVIGQDRAKRAVGGGAQPLQAVEAQRQGRRCRAVEVEHPAGRPHRLGQDAAGPDAGQDV